MIFNRERSGVAGQGVFFENTYQHQAPEPQATDHLQRVKAAMQRFNERQEHKGKAKKQQFA
jgi:hypothetical protein